MVQAIQAIQPFLDFNPWEHLLSLASFQPYMYACLQACMYACVQACTYACVHVCM